MQQNIFIAFCTTSIESFVPVEEESISRGRGRHERKGTIPCITSQTSQLLRQRQDLHLGSDRHLIMCVQFAMLDKF